MEGASSRCLIWRLLVGVALLSCCNCGASAPSESGGCVPESITASKSVVAPGDSVVVGGKWFLGPCDDSRELHSTPMSDIQIRFAQRNNFATIATTDASGGDGDFHVLVSIPTWAELGPASLLVDTAAAINIEVTE